MNYDLCNILNQTNFMRLSMFLFHAGINISMYQIIYLYYAIQNCKYIYLKTYN